MKTWTNTRIYAVRRIDCRVTQKPGTPAEGDAVYQAHDGLRNIECVIDGFEPGPPVVTINSPAAASIQIGLTNDFRIQSIRMIGIRTRTSDDLVPPSAPAGIVALRPAGLNLPEGFSVNLYYFDTDRRSVLRASGALDIVRFSLTQAEPEEYVQVSRNIIIGSCLGQLVEFWVTGIRQS